MNSASGLYLLVLYTYCYVTFFHGYAMAVFLVLYCWLGCFLVEMWAAVVGRDLLTTGRAGPVNNAANNFTLFIIQKM
jgi:hypothetical protein